MRSWRYH